MSRTMMYKKFLSLVCIAGLLFGCFSSSQFAFASSEGNPQAEISSTQEMIDVTENENSAASNTEIPHPAADEAELVIETAPEPPEELSLERTAPTDDAQQPGADEAQELISNTDNHTADESQQAGNDGVQEPINNTENHNVMKPSSDTGEVGQTIETNVAPIEGDLTSDTVTVSVVAPVGSFPEGTILSIVPVKADDVNLPEGFDTPDEVVAFDISFTDPSGVRRQPNSGTTVDVTFTVNDMLSSNIHTDASAELKVFHIGDDGQAELLHTVLDTSPDETSTVQLDADQFSIYALAKYSIPSPRSGTGNATEKTDIKITEFTILEQSGETPTSISTGHRYTLRLAWDASAYGNTLLSGDYFVVTLPDQMQFPTNHSATHFDIYAEDGSVIANAVVNSNGSAGGGNIVVTFTDYVENRYNINGKMALSFTLIKEKILSGQTNTFSVSVSSNVFDFDVDIDEAGPGNPVDPDEVLFKRASKSASTDEYAQWTARINFAKYTLPNATISDTLRTTTPGFVSQYIPDSFELQERVFDEYGNNTATVNTWSAAQLGDRLQFSEDFTSFTLNMENVAGKQFYLKYRTTYSPGVVLHNTMTLTSNQDTWSSEFEYQAASSSGEGEGTLNSRIKIVKKDKVTGSVLANAVFEITNKATNETITLTTDGNGEAVSNKLIAGEYVIKEVSAPPGYLLDDREYTVSVSETQPCEVEILNVPVYEYTLPETGGMGKFPFIMLGGALIALSLLLNRQKRKQQAT